MSDLITRPPFVVSWWEQVRAGARIVQKCLDCGALQMHPRRRCNTCASDRLEFQPISGKAKIYTFSEILRNAPSDFQAQLPYVLAIVELDEGPRMLTRIVNADPQSLACDLPVRWTMAEIGGQAMPCFEPERG